MNVTEDVFERIKVDEGEDVLATYLNKALEKIKAVEGKGEDRLEGEDRVVGEDRAEGKDGLKERLKEVFPS
jgi:hypothetical protein